MNALVTVQYLPIAQALMLTAILAIIAIPVVTVWAMARQSIFVPIATYLVVVCAAIVWIGGRL